MVSLTLHQAVYGPLANGSNVQLLAHSHGIPLDRPALSEFGKFYYAGWKIAERDRASFNAFLPLDAQHWGFVHAYVAGERSMGVMFVNWMLVLDVADLDKIGWRTNLLWDVLAGQSQSAPSPGTVLEPLAITLDPGGGTSALDEAADNLAYSVHLGLGAGKGVRVGADNGFGLAEAGLAAALGRLGPMAAQCSYCTSAPLVAAGYETLAGPFAILASESDIGDGRALATAARAPSTGWLYLRREQYGIAPINDPPLTSHTAGPYAAAAFETHQNEIVTKRNFAVFKNFAASDSKGASAAPELLDLAVTNFDTSEAKAAAIDYFVQNVLPICAADVEAAAIGRAAARVADIAVASGAVYWLKPQTIAQLGQAEFFGSTLPNDTGLLDDLIDSLGKLAALASTSPQIESAMDALRALMPDGEAYSAYANRLAVLRAALPGGNSAIVTGWIRDAKGFDAAQNALEAMAQLVPATHLANFRNVTADVLRFRAEDALKNREAGDSGKTALLFATRILNNHLLANRPGGIVR